MTYPDIILAQEDIPLLVQALNTFALDVDSDDARKDILINAGIHPAFRSKLTFGTSSHLFANKLVAHFREYRVLEHQPMYHPMVSLLEYLLQTFELGDPDRNLFKKLIRQCLDNLNGLAALSTVGRIESPIGTTIGAGVLVAKQLLLTCHHVFDHLLEEEQGHAWVRLGYKTGKYGIELGEVLELDLKSIDRLTPSSNHALDYALIRIISKAEYPIANLSNDILSITQQVRLTHYPCGKPILISDIGQIVQVEREFIKHTIQTYYGSSGAPIFDLNWRVVALHRGALTLSRPSDPGITEGIPISIIWNAIEPLLSAA